MGERHLQLDVHDIESEIEGMSACCDTRMGRIIEFVGGWDRNAPILIHCWAGISRSTATAYITACVHNPGADERVIAEALRDASPTATPNRRFVALADQALGRNGRMSAGDRGDRSGLTALAGHQRSGAVYAAISFRGMSEARVIIGLSAVVVAVTEDVPYVVVTRDGADAAGLPFGEPDPASDRTLELSLRGWVKEQTGFDIGYVEQLYTFGDRGREMPMAESAGSDRVISISYLALTPSRAVLDRASARWRTWHDFFPWEDWRDGRPSVIDEIIAPKLRKWAQAATESDTTNQRRNRVRLAFALDGAVWNEERARTLRTSL